MDERMDTQAYTALAQCHMVKIMKIQKWTNETNERLNFNVVKSAAFSRCAKK